MFITCNTLNYVTFLILTFPIYSMKIFFNIIGAFFKLGDGGLALVLLVMVIVTLSARFGGFYAASKTEAAVG